MLLALALALPALLAQTAAPALTLDEKEQFLQNARIVHTHDAKKGVTGTVRATLSDGNITHDASIQRIEEEKERFQTVKGLEIAFRDSYKFNIAAYKLGKLLGLGGMIPPSVLRKYEGKSGAFTWWIEDVAMDEVERRRKNIEAPDHERWARQYVIMNVFDNLIFNTDRNQTNILYDKDWRLWMIDHTRAFRLHKYLMEEKALNRCDSLLLARLKELNEPTLKEQLRDWLRTAEINAILVRRDKIVAHYEMLGPEKLYDFLQAP